MTDAIDTSLQDKLFEIEEGFWLSGEEYFRSHVDERCLLAFPHGERGIVYTDERQMSDGLARVTTWLEPQGDDRLRFRRARSVNGGPWKQDLDFFYVKRAQ